LQTKRRNGGSITGGVLLMELCLPLARLRGDSDIPRRPDLFGLAAVMLADRIKGSTR
jgi:hypothetical protein